MLVISYAKLFQIKIKSRISKHLNWFLLFPLDSLTYFKSNTNTHYKWGIFNLPFNFVIYFIFCCSHYFWKKTIAYKYFSKSTMGYKL